MTLTPLVSRYSMVKGRSKIALAPAHITITPVFESSSMSAEISMVSWAPLCTPPIPPVAKTSIPASAAIIIVAATVVAPSSFLAIIAGISRLEAFVIAVPFFPKYSISSLVKPAFNRPPIIAMVAGTAPFFLTSSSTISAVSTFFGYGIPWEMMVLSKATTGLFSKSAFLTSSDTSR